MKILGASVLIAESMTMGFAILLAMKDHSSSAIIYGCVISFLLFIAAALVRRPGGFVIGSIMQIAMIAFGFVDNECRVHNLGIVWLNESLHRANPAKG